MKTRTALFLFLGAAAIVICAGCIMFCPVPSMINRQPQTVYRAFICLLGSAGLCSLRLFLGPTAADRAVAVDIIGILIVGISAVLSIPSGCDWYMDIGIAWALQSFVGTMVLAKYLEGKDLDE